MAILWVQLLYIMLIFIQKHLTGKYKYGFQQECYTPGLGTKLIDLVFQGKTGFQIKQQFVTKTLIPRIPTKHITNDSMKKNLAQ